MPPRDSTPTSAPLERDPAFPTELGALVIYDRLEPATWLASVRYGLPPGGDRSARARVAGGDEGDHPSDPG